jgi:protein required for attachment to host cells
VKFTRTWIIIADGVHTKAFQYSAENPTFLPVEDMTFAMDLPRTHDLVGDRPGRTFESYGARHSKTGHSDPHRELKRTMAHRIAKALNSGLAHKRYDTLVLAAPPVTLGDLRRALTKLCKHAWQRRSIKI